MFLCHRLQRLVVQHVGETLTEDPSPELLSLLGIHRQHGNAEYKGGLKQESEQCLTTTVTNTFAKEIIKIMAHM